MKNYALGLASVSSTAGHEAARVDFALRSRSARKHRTEVFGSEISRDLPWNILLVLYINHGRDRVNVSSIPPDVDAPMTSVIRWLNYLQEKSFIERLPDPTDRRVFHITLSTAGKCTLDLYFDAMMGVPKAKRRVDGVATRSVDRAINAPQ